MDPLAEEAYSWTPYRYGFNNPIRFLDPNGMLESTHIDEHGNVIAVYDDGNLGIYQHTQSEIESGKLENDADKQIGFTLYENSFSQGDKIDLGSFRARDWLNMFEGNQEMLIGIQPIGFVRKGLYAINAVNDAPFDPKSYLEGGVNGGSQISSGIYVSNRDLGNYAAGAFARINGYDKQKYLLETGAFQLSGNNLENFISNYSSLMEDARNHTPTDGAFQRTYGEDDRSNYFIRLGYENVRTIEKFNSKFGTIFYDDNRNYKTGH